MLSHKAVRSLALLILAIAASLFVAASASANDYVTINGEGSTWAYPAWHAWQVDAAADQVTFNYTPNGSSAGRDDFARQTSAMFADSEIPFTGDADDPQDDTLPNFSYGMLPVVAGGTAFAYNLPVGGSAYQSLKLNMATIAGIFSGEITMWNAPQIAATNPGVALPDQGITVVVRSDGSGATAQFKLWMLRQFPADYDYLAQETGGNPSAASSYFPVGTLGSCSPSVAKGACFVAQSGSDGVTQYTQNTPYTIDYDEYAYPLNAGMSVAEVENAAGYFTLPTADAVAVALTQAQIDTDQSSPDYLSQDLSNVYDYGDPRSYPMSMYTYEMVPDEYTSVLSNAQQGATLAWVSTNAVCSWQSDMGKLGYSPLPMNLVLASMAQIQNIPGIDSTVTNMINETVNGVSGGTNYCNSPTFIPGQSPSCNALVQNAPFPPGTPQSLITEYGKTNASCTSSGPSGTTTTTTTTTTATTTTTTKTPTKKTPTKKKPTKKPAKRPKPTATKTTKLATTKSSTTPPAGTTKSAAVDTGAAEAGSAAGTSAGSAAASTTPASTGATTGTASAGTGSGGAACNAATGTCPSAPSTGSADSAVSDVAAVSNVATVLPGSPGWATPETLGIIVVALLLALLFGPPILAHVLSRRGDDKHGRS